MEIKKILIVLLLFSVFVCSGCIKMLQGLDTPNTVDRERFYGTWEGNFFRPFNTNAIFVDSTIGVKFTFFPDGTYVTKSGAMHQWNIYGKNIVLTANKTDVVFKFVFSYNDQKLVLDGASGVVSLIKTRNWDMK